MIFKEFQDLKLSTLGFGAMRLPVVGNDYAKIDDVKTQEMIDYAMAQGVNYYDTAWGYHEGTSEASVGKALSRYPRESFYLATKFPGYDLSNIDKIEEIFEQQLKNCGVEYFDFYLYHNVCEMNINEYLDEKHGIHAYLIKQKKLGRIKHLGFSVHGSYDVAKRFLDVYGKDMEFCQVQVNYIDWSFQEAKAKVELLNEYNIPVWVMEPLRGGKLVNLPEEYTKELKSLRKEDKVLTWAFRFLQSISSVVVVLSGMSTLEELDENIRIFSKEKPLSQMELGVLLKIADNMTQKDSLPCTACRYCTRHCPKELDIPWLIELYNEHSFTEEGFLAPMAMLSLSEDKRPSGCIGCRNCENVCPQQIKISEAMSDFAKKLK